ncbi:MAG: hypothetical protein ACXV2A_06465 [Halobacteriota archaeon]
MTLVPLWIVKADGWIAKPCKVTIWAPALALGLTVEVVAVVAVVAVGLALDVAEVVLTFTVAGLGLGLGFEVEVHPATSNGAITTASVIRSKYLFTFDPFLHSLKVKELKHCLKITFCHFLRETSRLRSRHRSRGKRA